MMPYAEEDPDSRTRRASLEQDLGKLGWIVGRNLAIDYRWNNFAVSQARPAATELLALAPDVMLTHGAPALQTAQAITKRVPIIFTLVGLEVVQSFIDGMAHPGGNVTGFLYLEPFVAGKWLGLLKEIAPGMTRLAYIFNPPSGPYAGLYYGFIEPTVTQLGVEATMVPVLKPGDFEKVISTLGREAGAGMIIDPDGFTSLNRTLIVELAARYRVPAVYSRRFFTAAGGLASYGVDDADHFRQVASYLDRILRGEKAGDLPVQRPTKYELLINRNTAKALGLTIPETLLAIADEVIE